MYIFEKILKEIKQGTIKTTCIDQNKCEFNYKVGTSVSSNGDDGYLCNVTISENNQDSCDLALINYGNGKKIIYISHGYATEFTKKGIPESIILELSRILECPIYSSTNDYDSKLYDTEARTPSATKSWERMKLMNPTVTTYDSKSDTYCCEF